MKKIEQPSQTKETLKQALTGKQQTVEDLVNIAEDDEQLEMIARYKRLQMWEQDLLYLRSKDYTLRQIAEMYGVSYIWIRSKLIEIQTKLKNDE